MMRLVQALTLSAAVSAVVVVGATAQVEIVHLQYQSHGEAAHAWLREMEAAFEAEHPDIEVQLMISNQEQFHVMVAAGTPPDVVDLPPIDMGDYVANNYFVDIWPMLDRDGFTDVFNPAFLNGQTQPDGSLFLLPKVINVVLTWFNKDLFELSGLANPIELGEGWTWESAFDAARRLTVDINGDGAPEQFGMDRSYAGFAWAVHQAGGRFYDDFVRPTRSLWNTPEVRSGLEYVQSFFEAGVTARWQVDNWQDHYFWHGTSAIDIVDQPGIIGGFLNQSGFDWDMALQPKGPHSRATRVAVEGYMIPRESEHIVEAWTWLKFIALNEENVRHLVQATGILPAMTDLQPTYVDVLGIDEKNWPVIFENTLAPNSFPGYFVDARLNPRSFVAPLYDVWSGETPLVEWLASTHRQAQSVIDAMSAEQ